MKNFVIQVAAWSTIMIGMAYFLLPSYEGKLGLSFKFGLLWGITTGVLLYIAVKAIKFIVSRG